MATQHLNALVHLEPYIYIYIYPNIKIYISWDSSVHIVTRLRSGRPSNRARFPPGERRRDQLSILSRLLAVGSVVAFSGGKANHSPASSAKGNSEGPTPSFPHTPLWLIQGQVHVKILYFFTNHQNFVCVSFLSLRFHITTYCLSTRWFTYDRDWLFF